jgi:hypothetical protein
MTEQKRGRCPVCDRDMLLKKDGTLRHHGGPTGSGDWFRNRSYRCGGAGQLPVPLLRGEG